MRVLHFCGAFSRLSETFIYDLITGLEELGIDNQVVTFERLRADTRPFDKVHVVRAAQRRGPEALFRRSFAKVTAKDPTDASWPIEQRRMASVVKSVKPDLIHAHFGTAGAKMAPLAKSLAIPLVTTFHGFDATKLPKQRFWRDAYRAMWQIPGAAVGVSENICNKLLELGADRDKVFKIANGIELTDFPYHCPAERFDGKHVDWLFVGRLVEKKGILHLFESFRIALEQVSPGLTLSLNIVGDGEQMPDLVAARKRHGLEERVLLHGAQPHSFVREMMQRCHLHAQHSITPPSGDQEGLPVGLIEAAAAGLPLVATRHSGIPEIVRDGKNGFLVAERDVNAMGERMALLSSNPEWWKRMSESGRKHVEEKMELKTQVKVWSRLYDRVLSEAVGSADGIASKNASDRGLGHGVESAAASISHR